MSARLKELEAKLTLQQRKAALLLVENEILAGENGGKRTKEEIAAEIGVDRVTLWRWDTQNAAFIEYKNALADDMLSTHRAEVYSQLLRAIRGQQPSIKAIDLFLRRFGLLTDRQVVQNDAESNSRSNEDLAKELAEIDELLND
jgi:transcriptional regulator with XRE-family HTH domain